MNNYPDLSNSKIISFDIETYDPELKELGPGCYRKDGNILGVSISNGEYSNYYNIGHKGCTPEETKRNIMYLRNVLESYIPKLATNCLYDIDWLLNDLNINVKGKINDIQIAEPLIDEYETSYSLNSLSQKYLNTGKVLTRLESKCREMGLNGDVREHIYLFPYEDIKKYAIGDVNLPLKIFELQMQTIKEENLESIYDLETRLIPLLLQMRKIGVRIDKQKVAEGIDLLVNEIRTKQGEFNNQYGETNVKSNKQLESLFNKLDIAFERRAPTALMKQKGKIIGNPNFDKTALEKIDHPICKDILYIRECKTLLNTFFVNSFSKNSINGRIHTSFHSLRTDQYGTVSGRLSSSNPNLQQIPGKDDNEIAGTNSMKLCRKIFIPEDGCDWYKYDWSQIEYRLIAHYAQGPGSADIRKRYNENPKTDYHQWVMNMTNFNRKEAKMLNFAMAYFMGVQSCSNKFGWTKEQAEDFINHYHKSVPFIKITRSDVVRVAKRRGFIHTILNRKARVSQLMKIEQREHSMFNRLIQGSASDIMKKAMVDAYEAGVFNVLFPHLTVHDEMDVSVPKTKEGKEASLELKHIMETCVRLRIPIFADMESGPSWGEVKKMEE